MPDAPVPPVAEPCASPFAHWFAVGARRGFRAVWSQPARCGLSPRPRDAVGAACAPARGCSAAAAGAGMNFHVSVQSRCQSVESCCRGVPSTPTVAELQLRLCGTSLGKWGVSPENCFLGFGPLSTKKLYFYSCKQQYCEGTGVNLMP